MSQRSKLAYLSKIDPQVFLQDYTLDQMLADDEGPYTKSFADFVKEEELEKDIIVAWIRSEEVQSQLNEFVGERLLELEHMQAEEEMEELGIDIEDEDAVAAFYEEFELSSGVSFNQAGDDNALVSIRLYNKLADILSPITFGSSVSPKGFRITMLNDFGRFTPTGRGYLYAKRCKKHGFTGDDMITVLLSTPNHLYPLLRRRAILEKLSN